jgi:hypothetical protein
MTPGASRLQVAVRQITPGQPLQWLAAGWKDLWRCGWLSLAHGAVLALFGRGLPLALRTFLLTLAVVDDLLAIVVIAVVYTGTVALGPLLA